MSPTDVSGKGLRIQVPRESHSVFEPTMDRRDPVDILEEQSASRVPQLVPIRYGRMSVSPFTFYRGAAAIMANDLAKSPTSGIRTQVCGDAHLSNFGVYSSPERRLVFDINDFDETLPGAWEWDVKRLAASFAVAGRANGLSRKDRRNVLMNLGAKYRTQMRAFAGMHNLDVWYSRLEVDTLLANMAANVDEKYIKRARKAADKALGKDSLSAFEKLTEIGPDGKPRFVSQPPLVVPVQEMLGSDDAERIKQTIDKALSDYASTLSTDRRHLLSTFELVDVAHKIVGVGSVGTRAWIVLMMGKDPQDPLLLQVKQAQESVMEPFVGQSEYSHSGERVVAGQRLMQASSDIFLGWQRVEGLDGIKRDFYMRQLRDGKGSAVIENQDAVTMPLYAQMCGWTLARAHARSGDRFAIADYLGKSDVFESAIAQFAESYADQNERDYATLMAAIKSGRIEAKSDV